MSFQSLFDFERALSVYTGAPHVVVTDCCTHAIELCMRYDRVRNTGFTAYTYISIPQIMHRLNISYEMYEQSWQGEYAFRHTRIWDSARRLEPDMYRSGQMQCLSFGYTKPLALGRCGAILLDDTDAYHVLSRMRADGRDLGISPWSSQSRFDLGWHYCPTLEICALGTQKLMSHIPVSQSVSYPDCREIQILG